MSMTIKQRNTLIAVAVVVVVVVIILFVAGPFYIVQEGEQAVVTRFGEIVDTQTTAGLKVKVPFIDNAVVYSKKVISWDGDTREMPTKEKQYIKVDTTARWVIKDPKAFYSQVNSYQEAFGRLSAVIDSSVRTVVAESEFTSVVRNSNIINKTKVDVPTLPTTGGTVDNSTASTAAQQLQTLIAPQTTYPILAEDQGRRNLSDKILTLARPALSPLGIDVIDILIRQIRYSDEITESVYNRMITERNQIAKAYRSQGEAEKLNLIGQMENELKSIASEAYKQSEIIKGTADAKASAIYSKAYSQDSDFFAFWRALESYRKTLDKFDKTISTDADYFKYLYSINGR